MLGLPILVDAQRTFEQEFFEDEIACPPCLLRRADPRLLQCLGESLDSRAVNYLVLEVLESGAFALADRCHDARPPHGVSEPDVGLGCSN